MPNLDRTANADHRQARLSGDLIAWLGTTRPDGRSHLVPVWFHWDGESLLILTQPHTQKIRNLNDNPNVSIALDDTHSGQDVVIFEGEANLTVEMPEASRLDAYFKKYETLLAEMEWSPAAYLADYTQAIIVRPTRFVVW